MGLGMAVPQTFRARALFRGVGFLALALWLMLLGQAPVFAQQDSKTQVSAVKLEPNRAQNASVWNLSASFELEFGRKLREALDRGLPLQFAVDFRLLKPRWYWSDAELVNLTFTYSISYHALTRTYRLTTPQTTYSAPRLEDLIEPLSSLKDWPVIKREQIELGQKYEAQVRYRLVLNELPKPFQISALVNSDWDLYTDWWTFEFSPKRDAVK